MDITSLQTNLVFDYKLLGNVIEVPLTHPLEPFPDILFNELILLF